MPASVPSTPCQKDEDSFDHWHRNGHNTCQQADRHCFRSLLQALSSQHEKEVTELQAEIARLGGAVQKTPTHWEKGSPTGQSSDWRYSFGSRASQAEGANVFSLPLAGLQQQTTSESPQPFVSEADSRISMWQNDNATMGPRISLPGAPLCDPPPLVPTIDEMDSPSDVLVKRFNDPKLELQTHSATTIGVPIMVTIVSARNLRRADWNYGGLSDPYVVLTVEGGRRQSEAMRESRMQTRMVQNTLNPIWEHEFVIPEFDGSALHFHVYDKDWGNTDDSLGELTLPVTAFMDEKGFEEDLLLENTGSMLKSYLRVKIQAAKPDMMASSSNQNLHGVWMSALLPQNMRVVTRQSQRLIRARTLNRIIEKQSSTQDVHSWLWSLFMLFRTPRRASKSIRTSVMQTLASLRRPMDPMSTLHVLWDMLGMVVLLVELCWIPMQVYDPADNFIADLISWVTLLFWSCDILVTFNTAFIHKETGNMVSNRSLIALRYVKSGWFFFDVLLVGVDWTIVIQYLVRPDQVNRSAGESAGAARAARVSRVFRFMRLLKMMRLAKLRQVMYMLQELVDSEALMVMFTVARNIFGILMLNHMVACLFYATSDSEDGWVKANGLDDESIMMKYVISLQWSLAQFTPGSPQVQGVTLAEKTFTVIVLAMGLIVATVFVSSITSAMGAAWAANRYNMSQSFLLRQYLQQNKITHGLAARVTRYVDCVLELRHKKIPANRVHYLDLLSGHLNFELKVELHMPHLIHHSFFKKFYYASHSAMGDVCASALEHFIFTKGEKIFGLSTMAKHMSFTSNGSLTYRCLLKASDLYGRIAKLEVGHWFTEAVLWMPWRHRGQMKAIAEVALVNIESRRFLDIAQQDIEAFRCAQMQGLNFIRRAQAQAAFSVPLCDVPLDHLTGRPIGVSMNYFDLQLPRVHEAGLGNAYREAEDHEALKALWNDDDESESGSEYLSDDDEESTEDEEAEKESMAPDVSQKSKRSQLKSPRRSPRPAEKKGKETYMQKQKSLKSLKFCKSSSLHSSGLEK